MKGFVHSWVCLVSFFVPPKHCQGEQQDSQWDEDLKVAARVWNSNRRHQIFPIYKNSKRLGKWWESCLGWAGDCVLPWRWRRTATCSRGPGWCRGPAGTRAGGGAVTKTAWTARRSPAGWRRRAAGRKPRSRLRIQINCQFIIIYFWMCDKNVIFILGDHSNSEDYLTDETTGHYFVRKY